MIFEACVCMEGRVKLSGKYIFFGACLLFCSVFFLFATCNGVQARDYALLEEEPCEGCDNNTLSTNYTIPGSSSAIMYRGEQPAEYQIKCDASGEWQKYASGVCHYPKDMTCCSGCCTSCDDEGNCSSYCCATVTCTRPQVDAITSDISISVNQCDGSNDAEYIRKSNDMPDNQALFCMTDIRDPDGEDYLENTIGVEISNTPYGIKDDMISLAPWGDGFIEMGKSYTGSGSYGPKWITRTDGNGHYLMIPSKIEDYTSFISNSSSGVYSVYPACRRVSVSASCRPQPVCCTSVSC